MKSRLIILSVAVAFFALVAGLMYRNTHRTAATAAAVDRAVLVEVLPLAPREHTLVERLHGVIEANARVALSFQITGRIERLGPGAAPEFPKTIDEGSVVRAGDVVAVIEPERFEARLDAAQAAVQQRKADLARAQAALEEAEALASDARDEYDRTLAAAERGATTEREVERVRLASEAASARARSAQAVHDAARAAMLVAQAEAKQAAVNLADATLRAPVDGAISLLPVEPGQTVSPGQLVAEIVDDSRVKLRAGVVERRAMRFLAGQRASVSVRALEGQASLVRHWDSAPIEGEVSLVAPAADAQTGLFTIEVAIDNRPDSPTGGRGALRAGMIAEADIDVATGQFVLVPVESVVYIDGRPMVYMAARAASAPGGDGGGPDAPAAIPADPPASSVLTARLTSIDPVVEDDKYVLLRSAPPGVGLIIAGQNLVRDGDPVRELRNEPSPLRAESATSAKGS